MADTEAEARTELGAIIDKAKIGLLTTVAADGRLFSRPMAVKQREFDGDLWFFTEDPSEKTAEIRADDQVNVAFETGSGWVSVSGEASIVTDPAIIDDLWDTSAEAWFTEGREDPKVAMLKVTAKSAEYWAANAPKPIVLLKYAKAAVLGGRPDVGESHTVSLDS